MSAVLVNNRGEGGLRGAVPMLYLGDGGGGKDGELGGDGDGEG